MPNTSRLPHPPEVIAKILVLRQKGFGNRRIALEVGISRITVCAILRRFGYSAKDFTPETRGWRAFPHEVIGRVLDLRARAISTGDIGKATGMTDKSVNQILRRNGWRADMEPAQKRRRQPYHSRIVGQALLLRDRGFGSRRVAQQTGVPVDTVKNMFRRAGFTRQGCAAEKRPPRQVRGDITYLNPDPGMAWGLGLIYGDGHLSKVTHQVTMLAEDEDVVRKFAALHGTVKVVANRYWRATWCCARLYRELETYGLARTNLLSFNFRRLTALRCHTLYVDWWIQTVRSIAQERGLYLTCSDSNIPVCRGHSCTHCAMSLSSARDSPLRSRSEAGFRLTLRTRSSPSNTATKTLCGLENGYMPMATQRSAVIVSMRLGIWLESTTCGRGRSGNPFQSIAILHFR